MDDLSSPLHALWVSFRNVLNVNWPPLLTLSFPSKQEDRLCIVGGESARARVTCNHNSTDWAGENVISSCPPVVSCPPQLIYLPLCSVRSNVYNRLPTAAYSLLSGLSQAFIFCLYYIEQILYNVALVQSSLTAGAQTESLSSWPLFLITSNTLVPQVCWIHLFKLYKWHKISFY